MIEDIATSFGMSIGHFSFAAFAILAVVWTVLFFFDDALVAILAFFSCIFPLLSPLFWLAIAIFGLNPWAVFGLGWFGTLILMFVGDELIDRRRFSH